MYLLIQTILNKISTGKNEPLLREINRNNSEMPIEINNLIGPKLDRVRSTRS